MLLRYLSAGVVAFGVFTSVASADIVYDTNVGAAGFAAPAPFAPRILDFVTIDSLEDMELDGLRYGFTVQNASTENPVPLVVYTQFWSNVDPDGPSPLSGATSLGTIGLNWGNRTANGGFFGGLASGLSTNNDIILPAGETIGIEFRFRSDPSTYQPNASTRLTDPNAGNIGTTTSFYYIDDELNGFGADDLVNRNGKVIRLELTGLPIPEPASAALLLGPALLMLRRRPRLA